MRESTRIRTMARKTFKEYQESQALLLAKKDLLEKLHAYTRGIDPTQELRAITNKQDLFLDPIFGDKYCFEDDDYCEKFCEEFGIRTSSPFGDLLPCEAHEDLVMYDVPFCKLTREEEIGIMRLIDFLESSVCRETQ